MKKRGTGRGARPEPGNPVDIESLAPIRQQLGLTAIAGSEPVPRAQCPATPSRQAVDAHHFSSAGFIANHNRSR